jgi:hypothetical protein
VNYAAAWIASYIIPVIVIVPLWLIVKVVPAVVIVDTILGVAALYALLSIAFLADLYVRYRKRTRTAEYRARRAAAEAEARARTAGIFAAWTATQAPKARGNPPAAS